MRLPAFFLASFLSIFSCFSQREIKTDICVYGGTSAGIIAAYTATQMGKKVLLIEPSTHLGGLTTGGLGFTDIGNKFAITGLARDFYRRIGTHYGKFEHWIFEPKVASAVYKDYLDKAKIYPLLNYRVVSVEKSGTEIKSILLEYSIDTSAEMIKVVARQFIDCSYEGDLMARAGVSFRVGREANSEYNEKHNGVQLENKHQFPDGIDPWRIKGDSTSGLLWGISSAKLAPRGTADSCVQAYNYRICLTDKLENRIEITQPEDYNPERYELLLRYLEKRPSKDLWAFMKMDRVAPNKTDINNNGPFSTDMIGMNHDYPNASYEKREEIRRAHENYIKGLLYFTANDTRMPAHLREQMQRWGYPKDEYLNNNHWSPQMYVREVRRMVGEYVMTQANCEGSAVAEDAVGMAAYTMDSHNCQRLVVNGMVKNEGDVQVKGFPPYPVSYRSLLPKTAECTNLSVPVCLSATHIAYGSIRMEPVFMVLGQSAAVAAMLSIKQKKNLHELNVKDIQKELKNNPLADKSIAEILVDNDNTDRIEFRGNWEKKNWGYGSSMLLSHKTNNAANSVLFFPEIKKKARYKVYAYLHTQKDNTVNVEVFDGKQSITKNIASPGNSSGQHSQGDWVLVGEFAFKPGKKTHIALSDEVSHTSIVADAVLCVPVK